jgi:hypothetical protein
VWRQKGRHDKEGEWQGRREREERKQSGDKSRKGGVKEDGKEYLKEGEGGRKGERETSVEGETEGEGRG